MSSEFGCILPGSLKSFKRSRHLIEDWESEKSQVRLGHVLMEREFPLLNALLSVHITCDCNWVRSFKYGAVLAYSCWEKHTKQLFSAGIWTTGLLKIVLVFKMMELWYSKPSCKDYLTQKENMQDWILVAKNCWPNRNQWYHWNSTARKLQLGKFQRCFSSHIAIPCTCA